MRFERLKTPSFRKIEQNLEWWCSTAQLYHYSPTCTKIDLHGRLITGERCKLIVLFGTDVKICS